MSILVELKNEIKQQQFQDKKILHEIEKEAASVRKNITQITRLSLISIKIVCPAIYRELAFSKEFMKFMESDAKTADIDVNEFLDGVIERNRSIYNANQSIINSMDNDKIINYIDLERLLMCLSDSKLSYESRFQIFSMAVGFDIKYLLKHKDVNIKNRLYVELLEDFFNIDGSVKTGQHVGEFKILLEMILAEYVISYKVMEDKHLLYAGLYDKTKDSVDALINAFTRIYQEKMLNIKDQNMDEQSSDTSLIEESISKAPISREPYEEIRKYYKNGELISIPEDIESFTRILKECGIDENEQRYILGLVNDKISEIKEDKVITHLSKQDKKTYQKAMELLNSINHSNGDYYVIIQMINDIKAAGDLLEELAIDEREELISEIENLVNELRVIIGKYSEDKRSENTILFLCNENEVPYLKEDSNNLDGSFYKMVCSGIRKIRKDNQGNFNLVMTQEDVAYRMYDIYSSKVHLFFIQIDSGIFLIVGTDVNNQGYEEMVRRAINNEGEIRRIEGLVKDEKTRNSILTSHEGYLNLFNPDVTNVSRKRCEE